jgi:hypothetical protein
VFGSYDMKIASNDIKIILGNTIENQPNKIDLGLQKVGIKALFYVSTAIRSDKDAIKTKAAAIQNDTTTLKSALCEYYGIV